MSFLGKLKGLHSGPPAPPKRIDADQGGPQDQCDDDGDHYEAPPCERPAVKVPSRQVEENVYLGESNWHQNTERSSPPEPRRQAPPPRPVKISSPGNAPNVEQQHDLDETYIDPNVKKPPQINREEKPGKKASPRKTPPSRPGPAPTQSPTPNTNLEDDVYLDPNEGQKDGGDEVYLEPSAGCPPPPGGNLRMAPPPTIVSHVAPPPRARHQEAPPPRRGSRETLPPRAGFWETSPPKTILREAPPPRSWPHEAPPPWAGPRDATPTRAGPRETPPTRVGTRETPPTMMKPPVPRAPSTTHLPGESKTVPPPDAKRPLFPIKQPHQMPGIKLHLPPPTKESKPSLSLPSPSDSAAGGVKKSPLSGAEGSQLQDKEWFAGNCDRKTAEAVLSRVKKDGAFLVRHSSAQSTRQPYTLVVLYRQKVYNIPIRYLELTHGYALGKEGKKNEESFSSLQEIISHHRNKPILLIDSKSQAKHSTHLTHPVRP